MTFLPVIDVKCYWVRRFLLHPPTLLFSAFSLFKFSHGPLRTLGQPCGIKKITNFPTRDLYSNEFLQGEKGLLHQAQGALQEGRHVNLRSASVSRVGQREFFSYTEE